MTKQNPAPLKAGQGFVFKNIQNFVLATTYSSPEGVPSALEGLTSVFGMRTGVAPPPSHQNKILDDFDKNQGVLFLTGTVFL